MRRPELDEMQTQKRNLIGNQAYLLLFYLLLIDIGLYGFGFRWLHYPMNVFVIMLGCMAYYLIRIIWNHSFVGPGKETKTIGRKIGFVIGLAGFMAGIISLFQKDSLKIPVSDGDNGAILLFVFSIVLFVILAMVGLISKWQSRKDE